VGKIGLTLASLVAAIPAGFLSYLMVATFLTRANKMDTPFQVLAGGTLAIGALLTLLPLGVLIFVRSEPKEKDEAEPEAVPADGEPIVADADDNIMGEMIPDADLSDDTVGVAEMDDADDFEVDESVGFPEDPALAATEISDEVISNEDLLEDEEVQDEGIEDEELEFEGMEVDDSDETELPKES